MKIASSSVSMSSAHELETYVSEKKAVLEVKADSAARAKRSVAAIYEKSGGSMVAAMGEYRRRAARAAPPPVAEEERFGAERQPPKKECRTKQELADFEIDEKSRLKMQLLNRLLEAINGKPKGKPGERPKGAMLDLRGSASRTAGVRAQLFGVSISVSASEGAVGTSPSGTLWQRVTAASGERSEHEHTVFRSRGLAVTEDGRSIDFNVELSMSRSFTSKYDVLTSEQFMMTDPLIINLKDGAASVSDVKFSFDLDSDGQTEEISFAGDGSGFLALDVNENGRIDDGSELFGTKSGDGFADLDVYDEDGNHWIDENDAIYEKLRVWTRDESGADRLVSLRDANVGAIYLGSVSTEFSLNDAVTNETNAVIRRTGVYLRETGEVGTLSHVDLRC